MRQSLPLMFGLEDSHARMSQWREWGREMGLEENDLDSFTDLLNSLVKVYPEFLSSKTLRAYSLPTEAEISKSLFERWPTSGIVSDGVCLTAATSESPNHVKESTLLEVIETGEVPQRYFFESERSSGDAPTSKQNGASIISPFKESFGDPSTGPVVQGIAYCLYACSARHTGTDWSRTYVTYPNGRVRRLLAVECEGIQGFPVNWTLPNNPVEDVEKLDTLRYTALGNAVSVPAVQWIAKRIIPVLQRYRAEAVQVSQVSANQNVYEEDDLLELARPLFAVDRG